MPQVRSLALVGAMLAGIVTPVMAQDGPKVTVGGVGYIHYRYQLGTDSSLTQPGHANNFDVDRSYITVSGKLRGGVSSRVTIDVDGRKAASNQLTFRLYVGYKPEGSAVAFKLGMIETPVIGYIESLWGYRMQGSVALDRTGYLTSSDFGLSADGSWSDDAVNTTVGIYNGEGYSKAPGDQYKDVAGRVSVRLARSDAGGKTGGLRLTGFALVGKANGGGTRQRFMGMLSYQSTRLTLGAEVAVTRDSTAADAPETRGRVISAFGVFNIPSSRAALIARIDRHDPDTDADPSVPDLAGGVRTRVIAGVSYEVSPDLRVLFDADLLSLEHGSPDNGFDATRRTLYFHTEVRF
jgi:hypothetical protein